MSKSVAVITIHGMGDTNPNYYRSLEKKLRKYVGKNLWDEKVDLESVFYQDLLQGNQEECWQEIDDRTSLGWDVLRNFMLFSFADAASIEHSLRNEMALYLSVHQEIATAFDHAYEALANQSGPVLVIAHSLGCEQITNYVWAAMGEKVSLNHLMPKYLLNRMHFVLWGPASILSLQVVIFRFLEPA